MTAKLMPAVTPHVNATQAAPPVKLHRTKIPIMISRSHIYQHQLSDLLRAGLHGIGVLLFAFWLLHDERMRSWIHER